MSKQQIRLTSTVQKGGCAAKVAANELRAILKRVNFPAPHPELLVDGRHFDDAAIYKISEDLALVQTIDFFTPIVDTPRLFGQIAATNALSDVYAMGGKPKTCLAVLAFPLSTLDAECIAEVMQGAADTIAAAGANLVGGHSIDDDTLKFGLSVTGFVHPERVWANSAARPGDALILTKALGTGTCTAALKRGAVNEDDIGDALQSMSTLNNIIDDLATNELQAIHAATDITGFGLSGHSMQLAIASNVTLAIEAERLPCFSLTRTLLEREFLTKAHRTNRDYTKMSLHTVGLEPWRESLLHDPQTSGGLLLSVDADAADAIVSALRPRYPFVARIGSVMKQRPENKPEKGVFSLVVN